MYTIETLTRSGLNKETISYICQVAETVSDMYSHPFKWENFQLETYVNRGRIRLLRCDDVLVGLMACRLYPSIFDPLTKILYQDLLYSTHKRGTYLLLKDFIDFGKSNADHIISGIALNTNLKPKSLEKLGFKKIEEMYRMEVSS